MNRILPQPALEVSGRRRSVFLEVGLVDEETLRRDRSPTPTLTFGSKSSTSRTRAVRFQSKNDIFHDRDDGSDDDDWECASDAGNDVDPSETTQRHPTLGPSRLYRLGFLAVVLGLMLAVFQIGTVAPVGVEGGVIPRESIKHMDRPWLEKREDSQTDVCTRWAGQCKAQSRTLYARVY
jgi:hypothetical protein